MRNVTFCLKSVSKVNTILRPAAGKSHVINRRLRSRTCFQEASGIMRALSLWFAMGAVVCAAHASTLQQLTMDDMIRQSTAIVRAKVLGSHAETRGRDIYTYYKLQV